MNDVPSPYPVDVIPNCRTSIGADAVCYKARENCWINGCTVVLAYVPEVTVVMEGS